MTKVLVTGGKGQLGQCLQSISNDFKTLDFVFLGSNDLDISNKLILKIILLTIVLTVQLIQQSIKQKMSQKKLNKLMKLELKT